MDLKKNNSGFVLILSIVLLVFLGLLLEASSLRANIELQESMARLASQQAFYAAESGLSLAVDRLRINSSFNPGTQDLILDRSTADEFEPLIDDYNPPDNTNPSSNARIGYYRVWIQPSLIGFEGFSSVWVKSIGRSQLGGQPQITRSIMAQVVVESPTNFFISTAGDLHVVSGASIDKDILGNNIYFDVNQSLPPADKQITIDGKVFFLGSVNGNNDPAVTISGGAPTQAPTETFGGVDTASYSTIAQHGGTFIDGDLTINGNIGKSNPAFQVPNSNGVVYVTGNIHISGTVSDSMLFVAGGSVYIDDSVTVPNGADGSLPQNNVNAPQLGILAKQDVIIPEAAPSDMTVDAFIMADGNGGTDDSLGGIFQAEGAKLSKGTLNIMGSIAVRGANSATAVDLNAYSTRNYQYNNQFANNLQIPFIPNIAQAVSWKEVNPNCDFQQIPLSNPPSSC